MSLEMIQNPQPPPAAQKRKPAATPPPMADAKYGTAVQIMALAPAQLADLLRDPGASVYAKAKACQRLSVTGDRSAVSALEPLLADAQLSHYARFALEPLKDPAADEALRAALEKVKGQLLAGIVNSIGVRRDAKAIPALAKLLQDSDADVARAAATALARIRPPL